MCRICVSEIKNKFGHSGKEGVTCDMCKSRVGPYRTVHECGFGHKFCDGCRWHTPFQFSFWTLLKMSKMIIFFFLTKHLKWYFLFI